MRYLSLLILAAAIPLSAQTAKVIQLSPSDAAQAKTLHEQAVAANQREAEFQDTLREKYLKASKEEEGHTQTYGYSFTLQGREGHGYWLKAGWNDGKFEFSEDFKFIVPQKPSTVLNNSGGFQLGCGPQFFNTSPVSGN